MMESIFNEDLGRIFAWIGFIVACLCTLLCLFLILYQFYVWFMNFLGKRFKEMWSIVEYVYYRKEFKEWVKTKERHPKAKK